VGDMTMLLVTQNLKTSDLLNGKAPNLDFPESVIDMLAGGLGQPDGGWPKEIQKLVLGDKVPVTIRPGELAAPVDLDETKAELGKSLEREATDDDLYSHLMYPQVFADFQASLKEFDRLTVLPTPAYFYGLLGTEEINVEIAPGKTLFIKLISIGDADPEGRRTLFFELNGMPRETVVIDKSLGKEIAAHLKGEPGNPKHIIAPLPGMISEVAVKAGDEVKEGDKLVVIEAMKMLTTISAPADGTIGEILLVKGTSADTDDLLVILR